LKGPYKFFVKTKAITLTVLIFISAYSFSQPIQENEIFKENGKEGIKNDDRIVAPAIYDTIDLVDFDFNGYAVCKRGDEYVIIGYRGKNITPFKFSSYKISRCCSNPIGLDGKWGVLGGRNEKIIVPFVYDSIDPGDGEGTLFKNGKVGIYSYMGWEGIAIPAEYDSIDWGTRMWGVWQKGKEGLFYFDDSYHPGVFFKALYDSIEETDANWYSKRLFNVELWYAFSNEGCDVVLVEGEKSISLGRSDLTKGDNLLIRVYENDYYIIVAGSEKRGLLNMKDHKIIWGFPGEPELRMKALEEKKKYTRRISRS
jgi:hypothetical protein